MKSLGVIVSAIIGFVVIFGGILFVGSLIQGFCAAKLWQWFAMPFGLPAVSVWHAVGLVMTVNIFMGYKRQFENPNETPAQKIGASLGLIIGPFVALFIGWLVHLMMVAWVWIP